MLLLLASIVVADFVFIDDQEGRVNLLIVLFMDHKGWVEYQLISFRLAFWIMWPFRCDSWIQKF